MNFQFLEAHVEKYSTFLQAGSGRIPTKVHLPTRIIYLILPQKIGFEPEFRKNAGIIT
jgi:hypothetical protein